MTDTAGTLKTDILQGGGKGTVVVAIMIAVESVPILLRKKKFIRTIRVGIIVLLTTIIPANTAGPITIMNIVRAGIGKCSRLRALIIVVKSVQRIAVDHTHTHTHKVNG